MSNYSDNFNSRDFERAWGGLPSNSEYLKEQVDRLPLLLRATLEALNSIFSTYGLDISDEQTQHCIDCCQDCFTDLYYEAVAKQAAKEENQRAAMSSDEALLEWLDRRKPVITNPQTYADLGEAI